MKKQLFYLLGLAIFISACKKNDPAPTPTPKPVTPPPTTPPPSSYVPDNSFKIVAYMPSYRSPSTITDSKYKMITHLLYSFLVPNATADGSLQALQNPSYFTTLKAKAKANNIKIGISIGPATGISETTYATIAASPTSRANFVKNIVAFANAEGIDGVDMDWEYPRSTTVNGVVTPNDNFTSLMRELSTELHKTGKFLSAAVTANVYASSNRLGIAEEAYQYIDFVNIMQYDGAGYDTAEPLNHASYKMSVASLNYWLGTSRNLPKAKAVVGIPLYGKSSGGSSISFSSIEASGADVNLNVATVNGVSYGYNGIVSVKQKAALAKDRANGVMFWEFSHDSNTSNSLIKAVNDELGRSY